jgi:hypothetical protein
MDRKGSSPSEAFGRWKSQRRLYRKIIKPIDQIGYLQGSMAESVFGPAAEGEGIAALARTPWTPEEDKRLRMLVEACKPIEFIAAELKRSANAVRGRAYELRISLKRVNLKPKAKGK